jgi:putative glutathione S-transferase
VDGGEPLYGAKYIRELYSKADPSYQGRFTVPVLWDKKKGIHPVLHP